jgi:hypothetical protein
MRHLMRMNGFRRARLLATCVLLAGGAATSVAAGNAPALVCGGAVQAGTLCTATGTVTLTSGSLTLTSPGSLEWSAPLTGVDLHLFDRQAGDETYTVNDATGTAPGWHVTVAATTFTTGGAAPLILPNAGTFSTNGSLTSMTAPVGPSAACAGGSTCTLPVNPLPYPVLITTAATLPAAVDMSVANTGSGQGTIVIGGSTAPNPVGWWINVPSNALAGTYISTVTLEIVAGP